MCNAFILLFDVFVFSRSNKLFSSHNFGAKYENVNIVKVHIVIFYLVFKNRAMKCAQFMVFVSSFVAI